ncbi:MAG: hypothetical protein AAB967_02075, partial [Patescibacteria group bacterium]
MTRFLLVCLAALVTPTAFGYSAVGSVTVNPSKLEMSGRPGEMIQREFTVSNQTVENLTFTLRFENLAAPSNPLDGVALAEDGLPLFPLTPYLSAPERDFTLSPGEKKIVPVIIHLPDNLSPGGFYAAAVFSIAGADSPILDAPTHVVTRLAPLIFLRVAGEVVEKGELLDFNLLSRHFRFAPSTPTFYLTYRNTGAIYLNPYGLIEVKNKITGRKVVLPIAPWFVLPTTTRIREISAENNFGLGWYEASLVLNHGYGEKTDKRTINFVIVKPMMIFGLIPLFFLTIIFVFGKRRRKVKVTAGLVLFVFLLANIVRAEVASSLNYRLQADSLNFGGGLSS